MTIIWLPAVLGAVVTAASAPTVRAVLRRAGSLDIPNHRSSHSRPTPRGGGIACLIGVAVGAAGASLIGLQVPYVALAACTVLALVGFLDDQLTLPPLPRLGAQAALGLIVGWSTGQPMMGLVGAISLPVVVNSVNFMDGINGITGMVVLVWGVTAGILGQAHGVGSLSVIGLVTAGAALGFLPFNVPKASLFLGDVGSYLFGGLCGSGILVGMANGIPISQLTAPLAIYFVDVFSTLARRVKARESLTTAHRDHIYQRVTSGGSLTHTQASVATAILSIVMVVSAVLMPATYWMMLIAGVFMVYYISPMLVDARGRKDYLDGC